MHDVVRCIGCNVCIAHYHYETPIRCAQNPRTGRELTLARLEGVLLDPVYSGKAMAGLIDLIRKGAFGKNERVVFLHTGGAVGLFGYTGFFEQAMG